MDNQRRAQVTNDFSRRPSQAYQPVTRGVFVAQNAARPQTTPASPPVQPLQPQAPVVPSPEPAEPQATATPVASQPTQPISPKPVQAPPKPSGPQYMDFTGPTRKAPVQQTPTETPIQTTAPQRPTPNTTTPQPKQTKQPAKHLHITRYLVLLVAIVFLGLGGARFATAGSTAGLTPVVGAVKSNNGNSMIIQFTGTDGKLHEHNAPSVASMTPGTAVELAYNPSDTSNVVQTQTVSQARQLGLMLIAMGGALLVLAVLAWFVSVKHKHPGHSA